ncbi:MAG: glycosyltransferase [Kastovskya adunca ATA6-11-RM4]|nr:glycosyltransferase [Kastovskya adunca ATA6-11-RM4]
MFEIAEIFAEGFRKNGVSVELLADEIPEINVEDNLIQIVVAPHEFYPLYLEKELTPSEVLKVSRNIYVLNVEQPGSSWFEIAYETAKNAKGVFDINWQGVNEFNKRDVPALHTPLGYEALFFEAENFNRNISKQIDILFIGSHSQRREMFLSKNADFFSKYNCYFVMTRIDKPNLPSSTGFYSGKKRNELLKSSKIIINIHFAERTYFEWHRILMAIGNHCLMISEPSNYIEPLVNGKHFVTTEIEDIICRCQYYLENESEMYRLTEQAYDFVINNYTAQILCSSLLNKLSNL